jgi:hypothetical protein
MKLLDEIIENEAGDQGADRQPSPMLDLGMV